MKAQMAVEASQREDLEAAKAAEKRQAEVRGGGRVGSVSLAWLTLPPRSLTGGGV